MPSPTHGAPRLGGSQHGQHCGEFDAMQVWQQVHTTGAKLEKRKRLRAAPHGAHPKSQRARLVGQVFPASYGLCHPRAELRVSKIRTGWAGQQTGRRDVSLIDEQCCPPTLVVIRLLTRLPPPQQGDSQRLARFVSGFPRQNHHCQRDFPSAT